MAREGAALRAIVRIDPDGATERVVRRPAVRQRPGDQRRWLYAAESAWPRIIRLPLDGGAPEPVFETERVVPDGLAFDAEGGLWIGRWQPNRVYRYTRGELQTVVDDWTGESVLTPTNFAFAGADLDVLVLASRRVGRQGDRPGVRGAPVICPAMAAA